jgi:UDPglucose 6-dehydrogenase
MICNRLRLDSEVISEAVSLDSRIGKYGTVGGRPFDGKCLPKDLEAFRTFARSINVNPKLLDAISIINEQIVSSEKLNGG